MADLAHWLEIHDDELIRLATAELSPHEVLRTTMQPVVTAFYGALQYAAESQSYTLLHAVLINWSRSRGKITGRLVQVQANSDDHGG